MSEEEESGKEMGRGRNVSGEKWVRKKRYGKNVRGRKGPGRTNYMPKN
jgi:hypothetical protein